ncbi:TPA: hypothetical protein ACK3Q6_002245 [Burkholderia cepacia]|uniref:hypothetical protein n=1 Tax=Burkholderia cepacia TaxID=292 RepID=UPI001CF46590|nr:hypothetical protein [Burkholderia cepacia]MCA8360229.1 hypothetical protein [Burkholderia cepacia]HDR9761022.1 hypothetical protein [Burkholderia cepacia ATCC 25416]HDV6368201.1 hypothetical protein [Burkholderia cepacia]
MVLTLASADTKRCIGRLALSRERLLQQPFAHVHRECKLRSAGDLMHKPDPKIRATERPMRIAYVLEDGEDSHHWLDEVMAECFARHGGRQSLIAPCIEGRISQRYIDWLKVIDPDVVMLLTYRNAEIASHLRPHVGDTVLEYRQRDPEEIEPQPRVHHEPAALTSLSWIPFLKTVSGVRRHTVDLVLDSYPTWEDDGLIKDNFGTLSASIGRYPVHEQIGVRPLILTPENAPPDRWRLNISNPEEVQDAYAALEHLGRSSVSTLSQLSNLMCQPFRATHTWRDAFCLVVGDSLADRISCWNAGLLFDDSTSQTYKTLRVPSAVIEDEDKISSIGAFLRAVNWLGGSNGPRRIAVRSHSLDEPSLSRFVGSIARVAHSTVTYSAISSLDDCCPADASDVRPAYGMARTQQGTNETTMQDQTTLVEVPPPSHLKYTEGQHPVFSEGVWFVDLVVDKLEDHGRFSNIRQSWRLPKRRKLIGHFVRVDGARIIRFGNLSVPADKDLTTIKVTQPSDERFFASLITQADFLDHNDIEFDRDPERPYQYVDLSDKGRYLAGLLGMFGSLNDIEHTMNMRFWRRQFYSMAAPANNQHAEVVALLKNRLKARTGPLLIEDDEGWDRLADHVVRNASRLKVPRLRTRYDRLLKLWIGELNEAIALDANLMERQEEITAEAPGELKSSLAYLVDRRIFYRGHEWVCRNCSHRNWVNVRNLDDKMRCDVCGSDHFLPVDVAMDFRLNEFFATCLREHDTLTVACILVALRKESEAFFSFTPQTVLYKYYPEDQGGVPSRELDILCICDGKFVIGEVKARAELIAPSDIADLAEAAKDLRADVALLAVLSDERSLMDAKLQQLRTLLPDTVEVRAVVASWDSEPSAYLAGQVFIHSL